MRHEKPIEHSLAALTAAIGAHGAERDQDGGFPVEGFAALAAYGVIGRPPIGGGDIARLLRLLAAVGHGDLSVGRIFEGHVNALLLIETYGSAEQRRRYGAVAAAGGVFGVWNTDAPGDALTLDGATFRGRKNFASGVDGLSHAIVTTTETEGRKMAVVPLHGLPVDRRWWRPVGMRASGSHIVDFTGVRLEQEWILGRHDDYVRQPWFSAGAIRFAAVHVGGLHAVFDVALAHLRATSRTDDPHQQHRLGKMGIAVESGYGWLDRAAAAWRLASEEGAPPAAAAGAIATANATRLAVEGLALSVLEDAERAVGAAGMIAPHPLERLMRDLRTYLRQPNPDGAMASLGSAIADGAWSPGGSSPSGGER